MSPPGRPKGEQEPERDSAEGSLISESSRFAPYREAAANELYHLLFCDDPRAFAPAGRDPADWQRALYGAPVAADAVRTIASDISQDSRVRMLACNWLARHGEAPTAKELLGVIVEVPLDAGLDTLAAFADGGVRYINHTGRTSIFEGRNESLGAAIDKLFAASRDVIARIGPWNKPRLAPPSQGRVRLTFLVSDGPYFGEGPMALFQRDAMAGPVIAAASGLLAKVVALSAAK